MSYTHAPPAARTESSPVIAPTEEAGNSWGGRALDAALDVTRAVVPDARLLCDTVETEGWDALLDPFDAVARQQARQDLAGKLVVLPPGQQPTAPNEVSPEAYDATVAMLGDIRRGKGQLGIDEGWWMMQDEDVAEQYSADVYGDFASIAQTESGRALLAELTYNSAYETRVKPPEEGKTIQTEFTVPPAVNGRGTVATVNYDRATPQAVDHDSGGIVEPHVGLFHELVHALHITRGEVDLGRFLDEKLREEHQTVGLGPAAGELFTENAYRQERQALAGLPGGTEEDALLRDRDRYYAEDAYKASSEPAMLQAYEEM